MRVRHSSVVASRVSPVTDAAEPTDGDDVGASSTVRDHSRSRVTSHRRHSISVCTYVARVSTFEIVVAPGPVTSFRSYARLCSMRGHSSHQVQ